MLLNWLIFFENAFRIRLRKIFIVASYQVTSYYFNWQESQQLSERSFRDDNCTENVSSIKSVEKDKNLQSTLFPAVKSYQLLFSTYCQLPALRKDFVHKMQLRGSFPQSCPSQVDQFPANLKMLSDSKLDSVSL